MSNPYLDRETIAERGKEIYQKHLRSRVEIPENIGKIIAIDLKTESYEIDSDLIAACDRLKSRLTDAIPWVERIGYDAVYSIGGTLTRTAQ